MPESLKFHKSSGVMQRAGGGADVRLQGCLRAPGGADARLQEVFRAGAGHNERLQEAERTRIIYNV